MYNVALWSQIIKEEWSLLITVIQNILEDPNFYAKLQTSPKDYTCMQDADFCVVSVL